MGLRPRTLLGGLMLVLGIALLAYWQYVLAILIFIGGFLALFWRRAPRALW